MGGLVGRRWIRANATSEFGTGERGFDVVSSHEVVRVLVDEGWRWRFVRFRRSSWEVHEGFSLLLQVTRNGRDLGFGVVEQRRE